MTQSHLAKLVGIRTGPMNYLENGHHLPSAPVLYRLGRIFCVPVDSLFESADPAGSDLRYAALSPATGVVRPGCGAKFLHDARAGDLLEALSARLDAIVGAFLALEDICGAQKRANIPLLLPMPRRMSGLESLVARVRSLLGVSDAVIFDYLELFENAGLRVVVLPMDEGVQSVACYDERNANAFLFVNAGMNVERQIFRLASELGRVLFHAGGLGRLPDAGNRVMDLDHAAARFAALFLMPAEAVHAGVRQIGVKPEGWDYLLLLRMKHRFGVSAEAFLYRLNELGLIAGAAFKGCKDRITAHYKRTDFGEPDSTRRILTPNGRLGDLLHVASAISSARGEVTGIRKLLKQEGVKLP